MYFVKYLLSIEEFVSNRNTKKGEALLERAFFRVDEMRRSKAERMRMGRTRAACLGAGLLLQLAVGEALGKTGSAGGREEREEKVFFSDATGISEIKQYSVSQLLAYVEEMPHFPLSYTYGENGKPYFKDLPFYFNLSHSGDYVLCGFSDVEIGADIQQHCGKNVEKLARRFFSEREADVLEQAGEEREKLFYRLWARKEAYGKLTGKGVVEVLDVDMLFENRGKSERESEFDRRYVLSERMPLDRKVLQEEGLADRQLIWNECDGIEGYSIAFCIDFLSF